MTKITDKIKKKVLEEKRKREVEQQESQKKEDPFNKIIKKSVETIFKKDLLPDTKDLFKFLKKEFYKGPKVEFDINYLPCLSRIRSFNGRNRTEIKIELKKHLHLFEDHYDRIIKAKKLELTDIKIEVSYFKEYWNSEHTMANGNFFEMNKKEEALEYIVTIYNQFIDESHEDD